MTEFFTFGINPEQLTQYMDYAFYGVIGLVALGFVFGFIRGIWREGFRLIFVGGLVIAAILFTRQLVDIFMEFDVSGLAASAGFGSVSLNLNATPVIVAVTTPYETVYELLEQSLLAFGFFITPAIADLIIGLTLVILRYLIFIVLAIIIFLLGETVAALLYFIPFRFIIPRNTRRTVKLRLLGGLAGALKMVLVLTMFLSPFTSLVNTVSNSFRDFDEEYGHVLKEDLAWTDCESFCCDLVEQRHTMYDLFDEEKHTESSMCDIFMDAFWKGDGNGVSAGLSRFHPEVVPAAAADAPGGGDLTTAPWLDALVGKPVGEGAAVAAAVPVPEPRVGAASEEEEGVKKRACVEADTPTPAPVVDAAKAASCKEYLRGAVSSDVIQTMERYGVFSMFHMLEWEWRDVRGIFMNSNVSESDQRMVYSMAATFARQNRAKVDADRKAAAEAWYADSSAIRSEHAGAEVIVVKDEA